MISRLPPKAPPAPVHTLSDKLHARKASTLFLAAVRDTMRIADPHVGLDITPPPETSKAAGETKNTTADHRTHEACKINAVDCA
mmetsp:Transcript_70905/g.157690  ORF Transcript_70905/g.157690 Transcript_70905/m.157690 type:complete len:84 (+) Transcript_70905:391-642(+)